MIHTGKRHIDIFQGRTAADNLPAKRHVGDHDDIGVLRSLYLDIFIRIFFIGAELMAFRFQLLRALIQFFFGNPQRF